MSPIGSRHAAYVVRLMKLLERAVGESNLVSVRNPVNLSDLSEPEPNLAVLRYSGDFYAEDHPRPGDALLVIEVSETSLEYDRTVKLPLYARHAIPEVWIVDLESRAVEIHSDPISSGYATKTTARSGEEVSSATVPGIAAKVDEILT